eukprot:scaffold6795_cov110-Cylindrotheca_fusiformis.AAC.3
MTKTPQRDIPGNSSPSVSVKKTLAAAMEKLSLEEREKVYEDVHGVTDEIQETAEFVTNSLEQMDRIVDLINEKAAYEQAKLQAYNLVTDRQFRLSFLRYTSFNPKLAALRLVQYFSNKLELFGIENLAKSRITIEDLGETTTRVLELGSLQVLPCRDSKGRAVVVFAPSVLEPAMAECDDLVLMTMTKAFWYLMSTLCDDEETQKKGVVVVANVVGLSDRHEKCHLALLWRLNAVDQALPFRLGCLHYCYNSSSRLSSMLLSRLASVARPRVQVRIRTHNGTSSLSCHHIMYSFSSRNLLPGSHTDCLHKLMSFGIPVQELPFTDDGDILQASHIKWLEKRRKKEAYLRWNSPIDGAVDLPSNHDVLWGRGKQIFGHPGNRLLHELVEAYDGQYNGRSKDGKTQVADQIIAVVHGYSGRFLKTDHESGMWIEVSQLEAREKVTHRFRRNRAVVQKGGASTHSNEPIVAWTSKDKDGGSKRSRMMFNGS